MLQLNHRSKFHDELDKKKKKKNVECNRIHIAKFENRSIKSNKIDNEIGANKIIDIAIQSQIQLSRKKEMNKKHKKTKTKTLNRIESNPNRNVRKQIHQIQRN